MTDKRKYKYKVVSKKVVPGLYKFTFGRGKNQLVAHAIKTADGRWALRNDSDGYLRRLRFPSDKLKHIKDLWGEWADTHWHTHRAEVSALKACLVVNSATAPPRPRVKRPVAPLAQRADKKGKVDHIENDISVEDIYLPDPFDAAMFDDARKITAMGALDAVFNYMKDEIPFKSRTEYPWVHVQNVLRRTFPERKKYK